MLQLDEELTTFLSKLELNLYDAGVTINLMELFPLSKQGILMIRSATYLIWLYGIFNSVNKENNVVCLKDIKYLINGFFQGKNLNLVDDLEQLVFSKSKRLDNDILKEACLLEYNIISILTQKFIVSVFISDYYRLLDSCNILDNKIFDVLISHPKLNKLHNAILYYDLQNVRENIISYDCRSNNYRAYFLSLQRNDKDIMECVTCNIVSRILLHREILRIHCIDDVYSSMITCM